MFVFPGEDIDNITIDGYSSVTVTPKGGAAGSVGYCGKISAYMNAINRELTKGTVTVGFNLGIKWETAQTRSADVEAHIDAREADAVVAAGQMTSVTLENVFITTNVKLEFSNKSESMIECEAVKPGIRPSVAKTFVTNVGS